MFCRFAVEYAKEIETLPDDECRTVQFDFEFYEKKEASEDEKAKKLQKKKETTEKLKVLAQERRAAKLEEDKQNLEYFEDLVRKKEESELTESDFEAQIEESGFEDEEDFMKYLKNLKKKLQEREKKSDANANEGDFDEDVSMADKFNLVDVPDEQLTPEQIKEKRRQKLMKAGVDARIRKQEEKHRLEREAQEKKEEQKRQYSENPEEFMGSLLSKRKLLMESREQRKKSKAMLSDRKSDLSKRRIQVLAELGKSMDPDQEVNDSFGARDADWDIYRQVQTNNEEDDQSEDEKTQIRNLEELVRELDPSQLPIEVAEGSQLVPDKKSIARYFQLDMFIERLRVITEKSLCKYLIHIF
jgi:actin-related protein 5